MGAGPLPSRQPLLVELLGPPGVGKSTIFAALRARQPAIEPMPSLRRQERTALLARHVATTVATLARSRALGSQWNRERLLMMAYLSALPHALEGVAGAARRVVVFDQGPLYFLSRPVLRDPRLTLWSSQTLETWRTLLDAVVWLDAPDAELVRRINQRAKLHRLKGQSDEQVRGMLEDVRATHAEIVGRLAGPSGPQVLRFDTSTRSAGAIADGVIRVLGTADDSSDAAAGSAARPTCRP